MNKINSKFAFAFPAFITFMTLVVAIMIFIEPKKEAEYKHAEEAKILIKKVEIVPRTYMDTDQMSIKVIIKDPIQCGEHTTTVLYNSFIGRGHIRLLLPIANPDINYYINISDSKVNWSNNKCFISLFTVTVK